MSKRSVLATLFALALTTGCAADTSSLELALDESGEIDPDRFRCARTVGEWGSDEEPPTIGIPLGEQLLDPSEVFASVDLEDPRDRLLAEYTAVHVNIAVGAELDSDDIDLLVDAEQALVHPAGAAELDRLSQAVFALNARMAERMPCLTQGTGTMTDDLGKPYMDPEDVDEPLFGHRWHILMPSPFAER